MKAYAKEVFYMKPTTEPKIKIGEKIRLLRKKNDVTQDMLADHLGVTPQAVSRWESGICYPDMNYLPLIADYFGATMDDLLCYNGLQREQRVKEYLEAAEHLMDLDRITDAIELLRNALADIPSGYALQLELANVLSLYVLNHPGEESRAALDEAVALCHHILDNCTDDGIRDETKKTLCDIYAHLLDDNDKALEIADRLHSMSVCREIIKATILTGDVAFAQAQKNLIHFADNIWWHLYNLACVPDISGNRYSLADKIAIMRKSVELFELIFEETPLFYADRIANSYRQLAMLYLAAGDIPQALQCVDSMANAAIAYDHRPDTAIYSSVIINRVPYDRAEDTEARGLSKCARLLQGNFSSRIWSPIRRDPRFRDAVARMAACAREFEEA